MKKKMVRFVLAFALVFVCFVLASCRHKETFQFLHSTDEITAVSIVSLTFDENKQLVQTELTTVEDTNAFLRDFRSVDCYTYFGDPAGITPEGRNATVIKISYRNMDYELINWNGQAEYKTEKGLNYYTGFSVFDEKQFSALIFKYYPSRSN